MCQTIGDTINSGNSSFQTIKPNGIFYSEQKKSSNKQENSINNHQINFDKSLAAELELKLSNKEKEIEKITNKQEKDKAKVEIYLHILNDLGLNNKPYQHLISKLKSGLEKVFN